MEPVDGAPCFFSGSLTLGACGLPSTDRLADCFVAGNGKIQGGKRHEMPAHHTLEAYLDAYIEAAGIRDSGKTPLFRSAAGRTGTLTGRPMNCVDAWRMIQRRAAETGITIRIGCHTFLATGITVYRAKGGSLEGAQAMAAHASPRTTKLYDRTGDEITLDEVERITI